MKYNDTLQFKFKNIKRARGSLDISFSKKGISRMYYKNPLRSFSNDDGIENIPTAVIVNTSGGIVSGDKHKVCINIDKNSKALIFSQAAEKIYKSLNNDYAEINNDIFVGENSWIEWLPQETIVFENSRLKRNLNIYLSKNSESLAGEIVVLGRLAKGEFVNNVYLKDAISIYKNGKIQWVDIALLKEGVNNARSSSTRLDGANSFFTIVLSSEKVKKYKKAIVDLTTSFIKKIKISVTLVNENLVIKGLSEDPLLLRKIFSKIWCFIRLELKKLTPVMPKLWWI